MSLFDFITRLQNKPPKTRDRIAFGTATIVTLVIVLGWGLSLIGRSGNKENVKASNDTSPFESLFATVKEGVSGIETYTSDLKNDIENIPSVIELTATGTPATSTTPVDGGVSDQSSPSASGEPVLEPTESPE